MSAVNNMRGHLVKDGRVVYLEKIEHNLFFVVVVMYESMYEKNMYNSSCLMIEAMMVTGEKTTFGNGVVSYEIASISERIYPTEKWQQMRPELKSKDGFIIKQKDYNYNEWDELNGDKKVNVKQRSVSWFIDVPKEDLIKFLIK